MSRPQHFRGPPASLAATGVHFLIVQAELQPHYLTARREYFLFSHKIFSNEWNIFCIFWWNIFCVSDEIISAEWNKHMTTVYYRPDNRLSRCWSQLAKQDEIKLFLDKFSGKINFRSSCSGLSNWLGWKGTTRKHHRNVQPPLAWIHRTDQTRALSYTKRMMKPSPGNAL